MVRFIQESRRDVTTSQNFLNISQIANMLERLSLFVSSKFCDVIMQIQRIHYFQTGLTQIETNKIIFKCLTKLWQPQLG